MATARSLGGGDQVKDEGSRREMARARRAITNPKPIRLEGERDPAGDGGLGVGTIPTTKTPFERVRIGGVSTLTVIAKVSGATGAPTLQIFGQSQAADDDDTTGENNGRASAAAALSNGLNIINDFVPAGEEFVDIELFSGTGLTIDWVDVLGQ